MMKFFARIKIFAFSGFLITCYSSEVHAQSFHRSQFPDLLNCQTYISDTADVEKTFLSDLGAWHAYSLPERPSDFGSFIGPLIMDMDGRWLSNTLARLQVSEDGQVIDLSKASASVHYYPGLLQAQYQTTDWDIRQDLIFVSSREARIRSVITNRSSRARSIVLSFTGQVLLAGAVLQSDEGQHSLTVSIGNGETTSDRSKGKKLIIAYNSPSSGIAIDGKSYTTSFPARVVAPGESVTLIQSQCYYLSNKDRQIAGAIRHGAFVAQLQDNEKRWDHYLANLSMSIWGDRAPSGPINDRGPKPSWRAKLAAKSMITLLTNWRSAAGDLLHDGVFPSASYQGFYGVWSWDSWKQAVALVCFDPSLAKDNIRCLFDYQDSTGMVPDCVYSDKRENNWRDTKPPLAAWAVWTIYHQTGDMAFLREMYPKLTAYHLWWYAYRDYNHNGLCEYGSTDGTRIAAAWESGMDNAVRFDSASMIKGPSGGWSLNQESVDLNAYLYAEKLYLARIAGVLDKDGGNPGQTAGHPAQGTWHAIQTTWLQEAKKLKIEINRQFYSSQQGFYYDYHTGLNRLITIDGPEGWIPLWASIADSLQAKKVLAVMMDTIRFNTYVPLPTLAANNPAFNPANGYWRGPVWLDQFYYGIEGLRRYGYRKEAYHFTSDLFKHAEGLSGTGMIRENYHPLTGKGLNAVNFSWSAAFILLLLREQ